MTTIVFIYEAFSSDASPLPPVWRTLSGLLTEVKVSWVKPTLPHLITTFLHMICISTLFNTSQSYVRGMIDYSQFESFSPETWRQLSFTASLIISIKFHELYQPSQHSEWTPSHSSGRSGRMLIRFFISNSRHVTWHYIIYI